VKEGIFGNPYSIPQLLLLTAVGEGDTARIKIVFPQLLPLMAVGEVKQIIVLFSLFSATAVIGNG